MASNTIVRLNTEALGKITKTRLAREIREAGSVKALAEKLNVSQTTVRAWAYRLRLRSKGLY